MFYEQNCHTRVFSEDDRQNVRSYKTILQVDAVTSFLYYPRLVNRSGLWKR